MEEKDGELFHQGVGTNEQGTIFTRQESRAKKEDGDMTEFGIAGK
jgi:hypothetical protein